MRGQDVFYIFVILTFTLAVILYVSTKESYISGVDTNAFEIRRHLRNSKLNSQEYNDKFQELVYEYHDIILKELNVKEYDPDANINFEKITKSMLGLGDLHREGIPDYYTENSKVIGVKPQLDEAFSWYSKAVEYGNDEGLIKQGEIYQLYMNNGHPTTSDIETAKQFYTKASRSSNNYVRNLGYEKLLTTYGDLPSFNYTGISDNMRETNFLQVDDPNAGYSMGDRSQPTPEVFQRSNNNNNTIVDDLPPAILTAEAQEQILNILGNTVPEVLENGARLNDTQNTHDHSVVKSMKRNYYKLHEQQKTDNQVQRLISQGTITANTPIGYVTGEIQEETQNKDIVEKVMNLINAKLKGNEAKMRDALRVLKRIGETSTIISGTKDTLLGTLRLAYQRIQNTKSPTIKNNLKDNLVNHLAEGVEHGHVICSRGIFNKIMDVFTVTDPEMEVGKPMWIFRNEILSKASSIRNQLQKEHDPEAPDFDLLFEKRVTNALYQDYVETGILDEKVLKTEIERLKII